MDKIYTRKRIRLPKVRFLDFSKRGKKKKIAYEVTFILIISMITLTLIIKSISPIIDKACMDTAKAKATIVSNNMATEVMKRYTYDDLVKIYKDSNGNITMVQSNIIAINEITSDVAVKIQDELIKNDESNVDLKLRKFYRNKNIIWNRTQYRYKVFRHRYCGDKGKVRVSKCWSKSDNT